MRKRLLRFLLLTLVPFIGAIFIKLLYWSYKKVWHLPTEMPKEPVVFVLWHGDLLIQPYIYPKLRENERAKVIISDHFDGQIIAKTMEGYTSFGSIHGSSTRNGAKVLISSLRDMRDGYDIAITPDGPKGPRHEVKDGVIALAHKSKAKVVALSIVPKRYWQFKSWDRFTIPKPFTTIEMYASEPMDISGLSHDEARERITSALLKHDY